MALRKSRSVRLRSEPTPNGADSEERVPERLAERGSGVWEVAWRVRVDHERPHAVAEVPDDSIGVAGLGDRTHARPDAVRGHTGEQAPLVTRDPREHRHLREVALA